MNRSYIFQYKSNRDNPVYFDVKVTENDRGLGQKEYRMEIFLTNVLYNVPDKEVAMKQLMSEFPDFNENKITALDFDSDSNCCYIQLEDFPFRKLNNLRSFKSNSRSYQSVIDDLFQEATKSVHLQNLSVSNAWVNRLKGEDIRINSPVLKNIEIDNVSIPVEILKSLPAEKRIYNILMPVETLDRYGIPITLQNLLLANELEPTEAAMERDRDEYRYYSELGLRETFEYNTIDVSDIEYHKTRQRFELKRAFEEHFNRYPQRIRPFQVLMVDGWYTAEEIASKFDNKLFNKGKEYNIPLYYRMAMLMQLNKNEYMAALPSDNVPLIAMLCAGAGAKGNERYVDAARFLIKHPNINPELAHKIAKAVFNSKECKITPDMLVEDVRSYLITSEGAAEMGRIENKYDNFSFEDAVFDLRFSEADSGNLHAEIMKPGDTRMAILGQATDCCQHLEGMGETAMMYGLVYEHAGFWIVEDKNTDKIYAQAEIWEKDPDTLVFDNIEFADNSDVSRFAEIIGLWAKNSPYKNVYMGLGYNELCDEMGTDIRLISGCRPPENNTVRNIISGTIYSDAARQAVIKQNDIVEPYFSKNHDGRLLTKMGDKKANTVDSFLSENENAVVSENYEMAKQLIEDGKSPEEVNEALVKRAEQKNKELSQIELIGKVMDMCFVDNNSFNFNDRQTLSTLDTFCRIVYQNEVITNMEPDEKLKIAKDMAIYAYNTHQRKNRGMIPVKVVDAISEQIKTYDDLSNVSPETILEDTYAAFPDCKKGIRNGTAEMVPIYEKVSSGLEQYSRYNMHARLDSCFQDIAGRACTPYFDEHGYAEFINAHEKEVFVYIRGEKFKDNVSEICMRRLNEMAAAHIKKKGISGFYEAYFLDKYCEMLNTDHVPQGLVPSSEEVKDLIADGYKSEDHYIEQLVQQKTEKYAHDEVADSCKNAAVSVEFKYASKNVELGDPLNVTAKIYTKTGAELTHSFEMLLGEDPEVIRKEIVAWADYITPEDELSKVEAQYPDANDKQKALFTDAVSEAKNGVLDSFDKDGSIRQQIEIDRQNALEQETRAQAEAQAQEQAMAAEKASQAAERAEREAQRVYLDNPIQMSIFDYVDDPSAEESITFDDLDDSLKDLLRASGNEDIEIEGDSVYIAGSDDEPPVRIPVSAVDAAAFVETITALSNETGNPAVTDFADQIIRTKQMIDDRQRTIA